MERLAQNLYISPPAVSQVAALGAFDGIDELEAIKAGYAANRALLLNELPAAGLPSLLPADGAFYLYADVSDVASDSADFAKRMLREIGVAITPGIDFDPMCGNRFVRLSYAGLTSPCARLSPASNCGSRVSAATSRGDAAPCPRWTRLQP